MADHNDPNSVNSIFSDVDVSAADVYDMFGYPSDATDAEKVVLALTFAPVPDTGVFDTDMLYRLQINPHARSVRPSSDDWSLAALTRYFDAVKDHYLGQREAAEIRVTVDAGDGDRRASPASPAVTSPAASRRTRSTAIRTPAGHGDHRLSSAAATTPSSTT